MLCNYDLAFLHVLFFLDGNKCALGGQRAMEINVGMYGLDNLAPAVSEVFLSHADNLIHQMMQSIAVYS